MSYKPNQGDIIILDVVPRSINEQHDRRTCLVVSNKQFNARTEMALVCPIENTISGFPAHIPLDARTSTGGEIICEQTKIIDVRSRKPSFIEPIPNDILDEVIDLICSFVE